MIINTNLISILLPISQKRLVDNLSLNSFLSLRGMGVLKRRLEAAVPNKHGNDWSGSHEERRSYEQ